jgi:protein-disulfide isomerase
MRKSMLFLSAAVLIGIASLAHAAEAPAMTPTPSFSDAQRADIEAIIKDYLTNKHPEILAEGLQNLQKHEQDEADAKSKQGVLNAKDRVFNDISSPVGGNAKGNVTVVEFYDYQCGYCKMSQDAVEKLLKDDKNVKFIYKEFPILGPASGEAAKAALASVKQGKFLAYHDALMEKKDHLNADMIYQVAKDVGIDVDKLKKDMNDNSVTDEITADLKLGQDIGVRGTPMFIVGDSIYPGAMQYDQLKKAVEDARSSEKKSGT